MNYTLDWGRPALKTKLTKKDIERLMENLQNKARSRNVFHIDLTPESVEFVRKNVSNVHLIEVGEADESGDILCIIGSNRATALNEYNNI